MEHNERMERVERMERIGITKQIGSVERFERMEHRESFCSRSLHMHIDNLALTDLIFPKHTLSSFRPNWHALSRQAPNEVFEEVLYYDS